ncbi:hypothetical protein SASPL_147208 [Salvia splendens]|uniref:Uncharacterized protein n=1 Tax=Salvia splendens TaxID=180675 RepID=A0A8X8WDL8_SALSN|nr:hypothetical protein SASPL_147208 [Salvia splendens]
MSSPCSRGSDCVTNLAKDRSDNDFGSSSVQLSETAAREKNQTTASSGGALAMAILLPVRVPITRIFERSENDREEEAPSWKRKGMERLGITGWRRGDATSWKRDGMEEKRNCDFISGGE